MSVAVGVESRNGVWLASDSQVSSDHESATIEGKVFRHRTGYGLAVVGSLRATQVVRYYLDIKHPSKSRDPEAWCVRQLVPRIRDLCDRHKVWEDKPDFAGLVAVKGRLYVIGEDWSVARHLSGYAAIGSGCDYALGAMAAVKAVLNLRPDQRVRRAVEATIAHHPNVGGPVAGPLWIPAEP